MLENEDEGDEEFNPRDYVVSDHSWIKQLTDQGWVRAPIGVSSVRKDYFSAQGWRMHVWAEQDEDSSLRKFADDVHIVVCGPSSDQIGYTWVKESDLMQIVRELDDTIDLHEAYAPVREAVRQLVARYKPPIREAEEEGDEEFDVRSQLLDSPEIVQWLLDRGYRNYNPEWEAYDKEFNNAGRVAVMRRSHIDKWFIALFQRTDANGTFGGVNNIEVPFGQPNTFKATVENFEKEAMSFPPLPSGGRYMDEAMEPVAPDEEGDEEFNPRDYIVSGGDRDAAIEELQKEDHWNKFQTYYSNKVDVLSKTARAPRGNSVSVYVCCPHGSDEFMVTVVDDRMNWPQRKTYHLRGYVGPDSVRFLANQLIKKALHANSQPEMDEQMLEVYSSCNARMEEETVHRWPESCPAAIVAKLLEDEGLDDEGDEEFDPREYMLRGDDLDQFAKANGFEPTAERCYQKRFSTELVDVRMVVTGVVQGNADLTRHSGTMFIEARPKDWYATGTWNQRGDFSTLLYTEWYGKDVPAHILKNALDVFEDTSLDYEKLKDVLDAVVNVTESRPEAIAAKLLEDDEGDEEFNPRDYVVAAADSAQQAIYDLINAGWLKEESNEKPMACDMVSTSSGAPYLVYAYPDTASMVTITVISLRAGTEFKASRMISSNDVPDMTGHLLSWIELQDDEAVLERELKGLWPDAVQESDGGAEEGDEEFSPRDFVVSNERTPDSITAELEKLGFLFTKNTIWGNAFRKNYDIGGWKATMMIYSMLTPPFECGATLISSDNGWSWKNVYILSYDKAGLLADESTREYAARLSVACDQAVAKEAAEANRQV